MSTYTSSLGLEKITPGSQAGLWGNTTNNTYDLIDQAITGITEITFSGSGATYTLTDDNGAFNEARSAVLNVTGSATGSNTIIIPNKQKTYYVRNDTKQEVVIQTAVATTPCPVGKDYNLPVFCDGNNNVFLAILAPGAGTLTVSGGGTGKTTFTTAGFLKTPGGTGDFTSASTVNAATEVSGVLPVANGGTGKSTLASGALLFGNGTGAVGEFVGPSGQSGQVATWNGSGWQAQAPTTGGVTSVNNQTGAVTITASSIGAYPSSNPSGYVTSSGSVSYATSAGSASTASTASSATTATNVSNGTVTNISSFSTSGAAPVTMGSATGFGGIKCQAYNFNDASSIFSNGGAVHVAPSISSLFIFYTSGNATAPGSWINGSDRRIKENADYVTSALNKIYQLKPITYSLKLNELDAPNRYGFFADELEEVYPELVENIGTVGDLDNVKGVKYTEMVPLLVKAIQELKAEIDALKAAK